MSAIIPALPVFPLDDYFVFPGTVTPLHVFETRYRQLMRDLMDSSGRFVMAPCDPAQARDPRDGGGPELPRLGTLVELLQAEELEDGRWLVLLLGLARATMDEAPSDRLYRKADIRPLVEPLVEGDEAESLRAGLCGALRRVAEGRADALDELLPADAPVGRLADLLLHAMPLETAQRRRAFTELDPAARARLALGWVTPA